MKSRNVYRTTVRLCLTVMILAAGLSAQSSSNYLKGQVRLSSKPLRSAWVIISQSGKERGRSLTGDDGKYYISNLDQGGYDIIVQKGKQQLWTGRVDVPTKADYDIRLKSTSRRVVQVRP
jgi:Carboxypeptidase regulatory-like domain